MPDAVRIAGELFSHGLNVMLYRLPVPPHDRRGIYLFVDDKRFTAR